jgi:hypothetical protein
VTIPWQILTVVLTGAALWVIVGGAAPSTKVAAIFFAFELGLLLVVAVVLLPTTRATSTCIRSTRVG